MLGRLLDILADLGTAPPPRALWAHHRGAGQGQGGCPGEGPSKLCPHPTPATSHHHLTPKALAITLSLCHHPESLPSPIPYGKSYVSFRAWFVCPFLQEGPPDFCPLPGRVGPTWLSQLLKHGSAFL